MNSSVAGPLLDTSHDENLVSLAVKLQYVVISFRHHTETIDDNTKISFICHVLAPYGRQGVRMLSLHVASYGEQHPPSSRVEDK
jgi:hypothetical protein